MFFCFFLFFLRKHVTSKNQLTKQKQASTKQQRQQFFARTKTSNFLFTFGCFFHAQNLFVKKINRLEIVLVTSNTILLTCAPINHLIKNLFARIYFCLCESLIICENLFFSMIIFENLFYHDHL